MTISWTNVYPTKLLEEHQREVRRFSAMLKVVRWFEVIFALVPLKLLMKMFRFSKDFTNMVALPHGGAVFGNRKLHGRGPCDYAGEIVYQSDVRDVVSPRTRRRLHPICHRWWYFPNLSEFYASWKKSLEKRGVNVRLRTEATRVISRSNGVEVELASKDDGQTEAEVSIEHYDEIVLCVQYVFVSLKYVLSRVEPILQGEYLESKVRSLNAEFWITVNGQTTLQSHTTMAIISRSTTKSNTILRRRFKRWAA